MKWGGGGGRSGEYTSGHWGRSGAAGRGLGSTSQIAGNSVSAAVHMPVHRLWMRLYREAAR